jgi:phosphoserine phosphatase
MAISSPDESESRPPKPPGTSCEAAHRRVADKRSGRTLAIFDFDKTLVAVDSFRIFSLLASETWQKKALVLLLAVMGKAGLIGNDRYKRFVLRLVWDRKPERQKGLVLEKLYQRLDGMRIAEVAELLQNHLSCNDYVAILSASPAFYLKPYVQGWANNVYVFASEYDQCDGKAFFRNMFMTEKLSCARQLIKELCPDRVMVYTDHISDAPVMRIADCVRIVRPSARLRRRLLGMGIAYIAIDDKA